jgi:hypothetical protein
LERITKSLVAFSLEPIFFFGAWFCSAFVHGLYDRGFVFYKASDMVQVWLASPFFVVVLILVLGSTSMMNCHVISDKQQEIPMRRLPTLSVFVVILLMAGCVTASKLNELRPNMERAEVIRIIGAPTSTGFIDGAEYLYYRLPQSGHEAYVSRGTGGQIYVVRLVNGRVDAYGRVQDIVPVRINATGR